MTEQPTAQKRSLASKGTCWIAYSWFVEMDTDVLQYDRDPGVYVFGLWLSEAIHQTDLIFPNRPTSMILRDLAQLPPRVLQSFSCWF